MHKYDFTLITRDGQKIDSIVIAGRDQADAERKLLQMYRSCTIVSVDMRYGDARQQTTSVEDILTLVAREA
ncbi:MAG TPA: hypothetical protein VIT92_03365 [Burkholderiaceae bacterium]